jgi:hypothetical protein
VEYHHRNEGQNVGKKKTAMTGKKYRSRIVEFLPEFPTADLIEHPENWRLHPEQQKQMLAGLLDRYGKIDAIIAYRSEKYGGLVIIDGHQRHEMDEVYPVIVLDVTDTEAAESLMTYNPFAELSGSDTEAYRELLSSVEASELAACKELAMIAASVLGEQVTTGNKESVTLKKVEVKAPPQMVWIVCGIPTNEFGAVSAVVEQLQIIPNVIIEMTPSDWKPEGK